MPPKSAYKKIATRGRPLGRIMKTATPATTSPSTLSESKAAKAMKTLPKPSARLIAGRISTKKAALKAEGSSSEPDSDGEELKKAAPASVPVSKLGIKKSPVAKPVKRSVRRGKMPSSKKHTATATTKSPSLPPHHKVMVKAEEEEEENEEDEEKGVPVTWDPMDIAMWNASSSPGDGFQKVHSSSPAMSRSRHKRSMAVDLDLFPEAMDDEDNQEGEEEKEEGDKMFSSPIRASSPTTSPLSGKSGDRKRKRPHYSSDEQDTPSKPSRPTLRNEGIRTRKTALSRSDKASNQMSTISPSHTDLAKRYPYVTRGESLSTATEMRYESLGDEVAWTWIEMNRPLWKLEDPEGCEVRVGMEYKAMSLKAAKEGWRLGGMDSRAVGR